MTHVGFYAEADKLERLVYRASLVAAMRAKSEGVVGVMITASSRKNDMNGLKLIDGDGNLWSGHWMNVVELIVNTVDLDYSIRNLGEASIRGFPTSSDMFGLEPVRPPLPKAQTLEEMEETKGEEPPIVLPHVMITADTRSTSPALLDKVKHGLESMRAPYTVVD